MIFVEQGPQKVPEEVLLSLYSLLPNGNLSWCHLCFPVLHWQLFTLSSWGCLIYPSPFPKLLAADRLLPCCRPALLLLLCYFPLAVTDFCCASVTLVLAISLLFPYCILLTLFSNCVIALVILVMSFVKTLNKVSAKTVSKAQKIQSLFHNICETSINEDYSTQCFGWNVKIFLCIQTQ